jgi:hypothetical protein
MSKNGITIMDHVNSLRIEEDMKIVEPINRKKDGYFRPKG